MNLSTPFASKELPTGERLFRRKHGHTHTLTTGASTLEITVPFKCKLNQAEVLYCPEGVSCDFKILDTAAGTYSTVPNYLLNQFGYDVNIAKDFFTDTSQFEADLLTGMRVVVVFNNTSDTEKTIGVNIVFYEVVAGA